LKWLGRIYFPRPRGDIDDPVAILADYTPDVLDQARRCLTVLESIDWKWDLNTVLEQPAELLDAIMAIKSVGDDIRRQAEEKAKTKAPA
jgi:hypothetical protein